MKILVTGKNGFIGSYLLKKLNIKKFEVIGISLRTTPISSIDFSDVKIIMHTSGIAHQKKKTPYSLYEKINFKQTIALANKAKIAGVKNFIFFSSVKVFGENVISISETGKCFPNDYYGKSKKKAEDCLLDLEGEEFKVTILRLPLVYGPDPKGNIRLLIKLIKVVPILPFGGIQNKRSILSISNLIEFLKQIVEKKISGIIVPSDIYPISTSILVKLLAKAMGRKVRLFSISKTGKFIISKIFHRIYRRLFLDYYVENKVSLCKFDLSKINSTDKDIYSFYSKGDPYE